MAEAAKVEGVCRTAETHSGSGCNSGRWSRAGGAEAGRVGIPAGIVQLVRAVLVF